MNKDEPKRLKRLQEDAEKEPGRFGREKLTLPDLLLLLREDKTLRALIRNIVAWPDSGHEMAGSDVKGKTYDKAEDGSEGECNVSPLPDADALRQQLTPELELLNAVRADAELAAEWLGHQPENEGRQLLRLVVCAAQWELLSELWDKLANRCKQGQRAASREELGILLAALALHNLRWQGRQAQLAEVIANTTYNYECHQRGTTTGDTVRAMWLPGLINAGGQLHKKPLVQT